MGVRNAQDAPTATDIRKGSGLRFMALAMPTDMGAMIRAVAALFITSERHMVIAITRARVAQCGKDMAISAR